MSLRIVMLGDVVGRPGRQAVAQQIPVIRQRWRPDLILANAENAANGSGLTPDLYAKLKAAGVDGMTLGDHVYKKQQIIETLDRAADLIRPANLPEAARGRAWMKLTCPAGELVVMTVLGRLFMNLQAADPFAAVDAILSRLPGGPPPEGPAVLVEVHAEATSEKQALGWHLNGRVAAVVGTHTHVATADARILSRQAPGTPGTPGLAQRFRTGASGGTAFISDIGMCGSQESVLGRQIVPVLTHMTTGMPAPFDVAEADPRVCGLFIEIDSATKLATSVERIELCADAGKPPFTAE